MEFVGFDPVTWEMGWRPNRHDPSWLSVSGPTMRVRSNGYTRVPLTIALHSPTWEAYAERLESLVGRGVQPEAWGELAENARRGRLYFPSHESYRILSCGQVTPTPLSAIAWLAKHVRRDDVEGTSDTTWSIRFNPLSSKAAFYTRRGLDAYAHLGPGWDFMLLAGEGIVREFCRQLADGSHDGDLPWKRFIVRQVIDRLVHEATHNHDGDRALAEVVRSRSVVPESFESLRAKGKTLGEINQIFAERGHSEVTQGEGFLHLPTKSHRICWDSPRKWTEAQVSEAKASLVKSGLVGQFITEGTKNGTAKTASD